MKKIITLLLGLSVSYAHAYSVTCVQEGNSVKTSPYILKFDEYDGVNSPVTLLKLKGKSHKKVKYECTPVWPIHQNGKSFEMFNCDSSFFSEVGFTILKSSQESISADLYSKENNIIANFNCTID